MKSQRDNIPRGEIMKINPEQKRKNDPRDHFRKKIKIRVIEYLNYASGS